MQRRGRAAPVFFGDHRTEHATDDLGPLQRRAEQGHLRGELLLHVAD